MSVVMTEEVVEIVSPTLTGEFSLINGVLYKKKKQKVEVESLQDFIILNMDVFLQNFETLSLEPLFLVLVFCYKKRLHSVNIL